MYVPDVMFWSNGRKRRIQNLREGGSTMLPNQALSLIFMGVTDNAGNAVFLVDSDPAGATGEGNCKPSGERVRLPVHRRRR